MERMTRWTDKTGKDTTYDIVWCEDRPEGEDAQLENRVAMRDAIQRLAEYEDIGLTPEEMRFLREDNEYLMDVNACAACYVKEETRYQKECADA